MEQVYYDPREPGSFSGARNLQRYTGKDKRTVEKFLSSQDAYTLHKPTRARFPRRKTYAKGIDDLYQADLVDVSSISHHNDGYPVHSDVHRRVQQKSLGFASEDEKRTGSAVSIREDPGGSQVSDAADG